MGSYSEIRFMNRSRRSLRIITAFLVLVTPTSSYAWNYTGHRVIASIAYRQLDDQTKRTIAEVLGSTLPMPTSGQTDRRTDPTRF